MKTTTRTGAHPRPPQSSPLSLQRPKSPDDIVRIVRNSRRYPSPLRIRGSGSSSTRSASAHGGTPVDLSLLNRVVKLDESTVTVQAGVRLADLSDALEHKGLELIGGFDLANRTIGGAVSSAGLEASIGGVHGSFASQVIQVKIVTADGRKLRIGTEHGKLLTLARLSYGLIGIVYEATLRVRPIQPFEIRTRSSGFANLADDLADLGAADAGLKMRLLPFRDRVLSESRHSSTSGPAGTRMAWRLKSWVANAALPQAAYALAKVVPVDQLRYPLVDKLTEATQSLAAMKALSAGSVAVEHNSNAGFGGRPRFVISSWAFREERFPQIALEYQDFCKEHYARTGFRCDMATNAYRLGHDRSALLSPSFDGSIVTLAAMSTMVGEWDNFAFELAEFAMQRDAVPLFNHSINLSRDYVAKHYGERLTLFKNLRRNFDADNRLLNRFFAAYLID